MARQEWKIYPDEKLKIISKNWDDDTWDNFLYEFDVHQRELNQSSDADINSLSWDNHKEIFSSEKNIKEHCTKSMPNKGAAVTKWH